jgi:hypothetical protein
MAQSTPGDEFDPDFTINTTKTTSAQYDKGGDSGQANHLEQVPIILSVPGPVSLRNKNEPYKVFVGKKK